MTVTDEPGTGEPGTEPISTAKTAPNLTTGPPVSPAAVKRSRRAVARSAGGDRTLVGLIGVVLVAVGTLVALLSYGVFGSGRAQRPLLDPVIVDWMRAQPVAARIIAIAAGVVLLVVGLLWAIRSLRPERRPDLVLEPGADTTVVITAPAVADAVAAQATELAGVTRARARLVGDNRAPALRLTVWLSDDADIARVCEQIGSRVLAGARESLGITELPTAVRIELDSTVKQARVA